MKKRWLVLAYGIVVMFVVGSAIAHSAEVTLAWDYTPNSHIPTDFNLYRQENCAGNFTVIASTLYPNLQITDGNVVFGKLYCYAVTAFDNVTKEESSRSDVLRFQMSKEMLAVPKNLRRVP